MHSIIPPTSPTLITHFGPGIPLPTHWPCKLGNCYLPSSLPTPSKIWALDSLTTSPTLNPCISHNLTQHLHKNGCLNLPHPLHMALAIFHPRTTPIHGPWNLPPTSFHIRPGVSSFLHMGQGISNSLQKGNLEYPSNPQKGALVSLPHHPPPLNVGNGNFF